MLKGSFPLFAGIKESHVYELLRAPLLEKVFSNPYITAM
jgi:hypothetical protein